ncbi:MAG: hypothetical protein OXC68_04305 [Aestuariivita sp.]|nr:hypothetical protein [Aestuariivita sp.]
MKLLPFQRKFIAQAMKRDTQIAALCLPRGNGKSTLAAHMAFRCLSPGDAFFEPGTQSYFIAASLSQARRTNFGILRGMIDDAGMSDQYRITDNDVAAALVLSAGEHERQSRKGSFLQGLESITNAMNDVFGRQSQFP